MEGLILQFSKCLEDIRTSKGSELLANLEFVDSFLDSSPMIPHSILKLVLVRISSIAKSKDTNQLSLEILKKLINNPFISELFQESQENSMVLTILLSAFVTNIERNEPILKKISWQCLQFLIKNLPEHIKKACFPGILKISLEELKKFRCQGFGTSEIGFSSALSCINSLQLLLNHCPCDEWKQMARKKASGALQTIATELILIVNSNLTNEYQGMIDALESNLPFVEEKQSEIFYCLISLSSLSQIKINTKVPNEILIETILKYLRQSVNNELQEKKNSLKVLNSCFEMIGNEITILINVYKQTFILFLFESLRIGSPVQYEDFHKEDWLLFTEKDKECWELLEKFLKACIKFELFDSVFDEQHKLMKKLKKGLNNEEIQKIFAVSLIFSCTYPDSAIHILSELIFSECIQGKFLIFSKFLLIDLSASLLFTNDLSLLETIENILFAYCPETSKQCSLVLESIKIKQNLQTISEVFIANEEYILGSLSMKLSIFGPSSMQHGLIQYLLLANNQNSYEQVLKTSVRVFDSKHKSYSDLQILSYLQFFFQIINHFKSFLNDKQTKMQAGNVIRNVLMRTKGFLALRPNTTINRQILQVCLKIFYESSELISQVPFEIDLSDHSAFAFEEDSNVSIPNGLSELSYEFLPHFIYCFKMMADSNCLGISLTLISLFKKIHNLDPEFFLTEKRFVSKFFGFVRILMRNKSRSGPARKVKICLMEFLGELGKNVLQEVKEEVLQMCDEGLMNEEEMKDTAKKVRMALEC